MLVWVHEWASDVDEARQNLSALGALFKPHLVGVAHGGDGVLVAANAAQQRDHFVSGHLKYIASKKQTTAKPNRSSIMLDPSQRKSTNA